MKPAYPVRGSRKHIYVTSQNLSSLSLELSDSWHSDCNRVLDNDTEETEPNSTDGSRRFERDRA